MASTTNKDLDYIQKDFNSTLDALITYATVNYGADTSANRLWTNFNTDSFSRTWAELVAYVADVFFFYFDSQATESYLQTATLESAIRDIAKQFGFTPASASSASGIGTFVVTGAGTISRGFRARATNGEEYYLTSDVVAGGAGNYNGTFLQGTIVTEQFVSEGLQNEEFNLTGPNVVVDLTNSNSQDLSPTLTVSGNDYTLVDTFIRQNGTDTAVVEDSLGNIVGGGGRAFLLDKRDDGTPFIRFGDGVFGRKLSPGETINITYRSGGGSAGNIGANTLTTLIDSNPIVSSITNNAEFSGGTDEQSIEQLRDLIPASLRTLERAVAVNDYAEILKANFTEVFDASAEIDTTIPGIDIDVYVVPQGNGIQKISDNPALKNTLSSFIDRRKTVTVQFDILDAFGISVLISIEAFVAANVNRATVQQNILTALQNFFNLSTGGSDGTGIGFAQEILIKDINNVIETVSGIDRFEIKQLTYRPRIVSEIIEETTTYQNSSVSIFNNVSESEWLLGAAGLQNETPGTVLFSNTGLVGYTYTSGTGIIQYATLVDLSKVAPGDLFRDGASADFQILAVDTTNNRVILSTGLTINNTVSTANSGSIRNGTTSFESFKCFKKINAVTTNLSADSITDNNLDLSVLSSTATSISARVLLDNAQVFVPNEFATGQFFLVDGASNVWNIVSNSSNTIETSVTAINDAGISTVTGGAYKIVRSFANKDVVFNQSVFTVQYNTNNTIFSVGAQFNDIGTIGDSFQLSETQSNLGHLGVAADLISYDSGTGKIRLNQSPDLSGITSEWDLVDSSGAVFNIVGVDNRSQPVTNYDISNQNDNFALHGTGSGSEVAQGFKVPSTDTYSLVSFNLKREGNIVGNLIAKIVNDSGGLPNLLSTVATSQPVLVSSVDNSAYTQVSFFFTSPPSLTAATQYHLVLSGDSAYSSSEASGVTVFSNIGLVGFTYNVLTGIIQYASAVDLSAVLPGQFFRDGAGALFEILSVDDTANTLTLATGLSVDNTVATSADGSVIKNDRVLVAIDNTSPSYTDGAFSSFDGFTWFLVSPDTDAIFSVEGTKSITIDSNLTPTLGIGSTISVRYYDDLNETSFILGITSGLVTSASDVNAVGRGTVSGNPNSKVDNFVFRTSRYLDDIVNLRANEIPEIQSSDITINIFGSVS